MATGTSPSDYSTPFQKKRREHAAAEAFGLGAVLGGEDGNVELDAWPCLGATVASSRKNGVDARTPRTTASSPGADQGEATSSTSATATRSTLARKDPGTPLPLRRPPRRSAALLPSGGELRLRLRVPAAGETAARRPSQAKVRLRSLRDCVTTCHGRSDREAEVNQARVEREERRLASGTREVLPLIMVAPLPDAVKEEDEGNMDSFQSGQTIIGQDDFMAIFRNDKPLCELLMKIGQRTSGSSGAKTAAPPPAQQQQPPPPAQHGACVKRPAIGPPPGFAGVRQPPQKQQQLPQPPPPPPRRRAQPQQPAPSAAAHHRNPNRHHHLSGVAAPPAAAANALSIRRKAAAAAPPCTAACAT
uniref:Uncharacterized protein n=1 Tax=Oryza meridionalis TaxID=40149 RepID=A0A0E0EZ58_9ORYZ